MPPAIDDGDHDDIGGPGTPVSITFLGGLYQDAKLAAFARAYQEATKFNKVHPTLESRRWPYCSERRAFGPLYWRRQLTTCFRLDVSHLRRKNPPRRTVRTCSPASTAWCKS